MAIADQPFVKLRGLIEKRVSTVPSLDKRAVVRETLYAVYEYIEYCQLENVPADLSLDLIAIASSIII